MALPLCGRRRFAPTDNFSNDSKFQSLKLCDPFESIVAYAQSLPLRKMALPLCGRRRFAPTDNFSNDSKFQSLKLCDPFESIVAYAQSLPLRKMALPLCGRRRFAPTGIFLMHQTTRLMLLYHIFTAARSFFRAGRRTIRYFRRMERIFLQGIWCFSALEKSSRTDWAPKKADASRLTSAVICYKIDFAERIGPATCLPTVVFVYPDTIPCK